MLDGYHILTLTHRRVALETIGRAVLRSDATDQPECMLQELKSRFGWEELMYLATCNRVMYLVYSNAPVGDHTGRVLLAHARPELNEAQLDEAAAGMEILHGSDAIRHLLEVAASLDSLVVGEREIIRQLREAFERSRSWNLTGDHLRLLMRFTIETAKEIYTDTGIGEKAISVVALAFNAMLQTGLRPGARILMVGAGQTNTLYAKFLAKYGFTNVTVFNRTYSKAEAIAQYLGGRALPMDELEYFSEGFDALIVCTGATEPIISPALYHRLLAADGSPKVVVDLSIPHNIDPRIPIAFPLTYIEIEGLRNAARENMAHREKEKIKAESIIAERILSYRNIWHERQVERSLGHIPGEVRDVRERAINEVFGKEFAQLDPDAQELVQRMMAYMEKKCVAIPMRAVKAIALNKSRGMAMAKKPEVSHQ
ncbi:MAG: glutamyl-tRNA reductase [Saprospiraceae bacterium]|nr:glutamyl-tRNA reductase [Saprospiraceae bacterium]